MSSWQCRDTQSCETLLFPASFSICICWCRSSASWRRRAISSTASLFLNHWVWDVDDVKSTIQISDSQENVKETKNLILDDLPMQLPSRICHEQSHIVANKNNGFIANRVLWMHTVYTVCLVIHTAAWLELHEPILVGMAFWKLARISALQDSAYTYVST